MKARWMRSHEQYVTSRIYKLVDMAMAEKDYASLSMLKWFVDEQVEEEDNASSIVAKLERLGTHHLFLIDKELGER